jgi:hypothetical protein
MYDFKDFLNGVGFVVVIVLVIIGLATPRSTS